MQSLNLQNKLILNFINPILHLFISSVYKLTMIHLLVVQLYSILNGIIMINSVINNNILSSNNVLFVLFQMLLIIFVFSYCNGCKNNGNAIVGINNHTESYIFILKRYLNSIKSISVGLIFCLISIRAKIYLSKEYGNNNSYLVCLINDSCLECDYIANNNIFVNNDNFNTDYGIFNPALAVRFPVIHIHDNYTIQGYGNNSKELNVLILRDDQAQGLNLLDSSTSAITSHIFEMVHNTGKPHVQLEVAIITINKYAYMILIITFINRLKIDFVCKVVGEAVKSITSITKTTYIIHQNNICMSNNDNKN